MEKKIYEVDYDYYRKDGVSYIQLRKFFDGDEMTNFLKFIEQAKNNPDKYLVTNIWVGTVHTG